MSARAASDLAGPRPQPVGARATGGSGASGRVPVSTYRLQLDPHLTFRTAAGLVPYLDELGVTDLYLSPFLEPSSPHSHGYDISDHGRFNPALGTEDDYRQLAEALRSRGMGQLVDVVPNHMGIAGSRNVWWADVLENGPASSYASHFDIDWEPLKPELRGKVLLPILGDQYGRVLEGQALALEFHEGAFRLRYHDTVLPVAPRTYADVLGHRLDELEAALGKEHSQLAELQSIITALAHLPPRTETDPARLVERNRERTVIRRRLAALARESPPVRAFIADNVRIFNGIAGRPESFDRLDALLGAQAYRLAFWQVARDEINYRRFFDVNELAAIRMEEPAVFEEAHRLLFRLIRAGWVTGLRIDHPDGLYAPRQYLASLQRRCVLEASGHAPDPAEGPARPEGEATPALDPRVEPAAGTAPARRFYIVAEKIVMPGERLPEGWAVDGTTGYDFLNAANGIFVNPAGERSIDETYARFVKLKMSPRDVAYEAKKLVMDTSMSSEISVLGHRLARISDRHRASRDFTDRSLTEALREIIACFPVYRTYIGEDGLEVADRDRRYVEQATAAAKRRNPTTSALIFDFIRDLLLFRFPEATNEADRAEHRAFVMKLQQLTGPVMAKGLEDTAFYRYNRLVSLNEVGGSPDRFGVAVAAFHELNAERQARWPGSLSATSTHDTKRSEDVRARINVLSEIPQEWRVRLRAWRRLNRRKKTVVDGHPAPDGNEEYALYQTLLGAWPIEPVSDAAYTEFTERIQRYVFKAVREAKIHASWVNPHPEYDAAVRRFVAALLDRSGDNPFLADFLPFQRKIAAWGMQNSLAQTLLKLVAPGVPDLYQGTEVWDLSLVDPDNRRPVDFEARRRLLDGLRHDIARAGDALADLARELVEARADGRIKLYLIHRALDYRRRHARLFAEGEYLPLAASGAQHDHLCGFARRQDGQVVLAVVPRLVARLVVDGLPLGKEVWGETSLALPDGVRARRFRHLFTGEPVDMVDRDGRPGLAAAAMFRTFPVALLEAAPEGGA